MQNRRTLKLNNTTKSLAKISKPVQIQNKTIKPYIKANHFKFNSSLDKNLANITFQNTLTNRKENISQKTLPKVRNTITKIPNSKPINGRVNISPKKTDLKNTKKVTIQIPVSINTSSTRRPDNKNVENKINSYKKIINKTNDNKIVMNRRNENKNVINKRVENKDVLNKNAINKRVENKDVLNKNAINKKVENKDVVNKNGFNKKVENKGVINKRVQNKPIEKIKIDYKKYMNKTIENKKIENNLDKKNKDAINNKENKKESKKIVITEKKRDFFISKKSEEQKLAELERQKLDKELESLSTFKKIVLLQNLLKETKSIKKQFNYNKNKMIEKIYYNCYNYFNDKVYMKEIFDYCISRKPEEHRDYQLISDIQDYLNKNIYQSLHDFLFLIRNNNNLMLKLINLCDKFVYEELSDFFVNFLYENVINSSFAQDELILMIYLLIEDLFLNTLPNKLDLNNNIYNTYINNSFLSHAIQKLTRKIDVRNFLCSILNESILRMENYRAPLSLDINMVNRYLRNRESNFHHSFIQYAKGDNNDIKVKKTKKNFKKIFQPNVSYNQVIREGGNRFLKRTKKIELGDSNYFESKDSWVIIHSNLSQSKSIKDSVMNNSILTIGNDEPIDNTLNKSRTNIFGEEYKTLDKKDNPEDNKNIKKKDYEGNSKNIESNEIFNSENININLKIEKEEEKEEIDPFFENSSVNLKYLNNKLVELRKGLNKNTINSAMKEYIKSLIFQIKNPEIIDEKNNSNVYGHYMNKDSSLSYHEYYETNINDNKEIYSTSSIIEELKEIREIKQVDSFRNLMKRIRMNYKIIIKIINNLLNKLKDNLISTPYIIKCISKMLNVLIEKKFPSTSRNKLSSYNLYMFKINFFVRNIILPIITNPEYNGLITTDIISKMTKDNLKEISDILNMALSGKLFNKNSDPYMTLFNQFIIDLIPQLFELADNIEKNFKLPKNIQKLIEEKNINNNERNINYDYFKENQNENIQYQSICFSWQIIYILLQIILKNKNTFIDDNQNQEEKIIFEKLLEKKDALISLFSSGLKNKNCEFFLLTKINLKTGFEQEKLKSLTTFNFDTIIPKLNDDLITAYKKCLAEVLCYVTILHKEHIISFNFKKDDIIYDKKITKIISRINRKDEYEKIINDNIEFKSDFNENNILKYYLEKISLLMKYKDDADFRYIIFPELLNLVKQEISFNLDNPITQRIIFCCNYLKLYMRNIPNKYKENNYSLLFMELIKETQNNINFLKNNILFQYYLKLKEVEKLNLMNLNYNSQIRKLEKLKCIEYLYNKLALPINLKIEKDNKGIITNIEYKKENKNNLEKKISVIEYLKNRDQPIKNFINEFPDFHEYEEEYDNILDIEEKAETPEALNKYFQELRKLVKNEKITKRFNLEELENIMYDLENYILTQLYDKLFPSESTKDDIFFYKKCARLSFIKPENIVQDKKLINESLLENSIEYINDIDDKLTPVDKIKNFAKAIEIVQNSITFSSGKDELGVDDMIKPLAYIMIKSRPKNISSNYQYCELYLNSELSKKQYGVILAQIGLVINIIKTMKYNDLIGVTEEEFGIDEIEEESDENDKENL